jgi:hypothetical protein
MGSEAEVMMLGIITGSILGDTFFRHGVNL